MSSWSTDNLKELKEITNHKVVYDGYEFIWMSKVNNEWKRHYVRNFDNYNQPMSWIHFNTHIWDKEYKQRESNYLKNMMNELDIQVKIIEISRETNIRTKQKIKEILILKPSISNKEISDILGVTIRTIERHKSKLNKI